MELPELTPNHFEILAVRELRKAGFEVLEVRTHRRTELAEPEHGFLLELTAALNHGAWRRRAIIACRRQQGPVGRDAVVLVTDRKGEAKAEAAILFCFPDVTPDAAGAAADLGVALLRIVDGRSAFDASGWGPPGHYPAWLPAYLAQAMERDSAGVVRYRLLDAGRADLILNQLR
ncbi:MAG TPA: restriction endonuclease [Gemmatimonadales bacterium]